MKIKDDQYVNFHGWMRTKLDLKSNTLIVFSLIYSFTRNGGWYTGGRSGLAAWCGATETGIDKNIKELLDENLIIKEKLGKAKNSKCRFKANMNQIEKLVGLKRVNTTKKVLHKGPCVFKTNDSRIIKLSEEVF